MRKTNLKKVLAIVCILLFITSAGYAKIPDVVVKQKNAVVTIYIFDKEVFSFCGSGFIMSPNTVVTNYHVVSSLFKNENASIGIKMENGQFIKAERLVAADEDSDIALIKVEGRDLPGLQIVQNYKPKLGEDVFVIGSPLGLDTTISNGIISSIRGKDEFLQITAPISPGSSGSPVFNADGDVIGIATLIVQGGQNLNFAIPIKYVDNLTRPAAKAQIEAKPLKASAVQDQRQVISPEFHINSAQGFEKNEQLNEAIEEYTKAIILKPDDPYLYAFRGSLYLLLLPVKEPPPKPMPAPAPIRSNDYEQFVKARRVPKVLPQETSVPAPNVDKDIEQSSNKLIVKAINDFSHAVMKEPNNPIFYYLRSWAYGHNNDVVNTIKDLDKAINLRPEVALFYYGRGLVYATAKQYIQAIEDFSKAIKLKPDSISSIRLLFGKRFENTLMLQELIKHTDNLSLSDYYYERGSAYKRNSEITKAIEDYEQSLIINPNGFRNFALLDLYMENNLLNDAIKFYSKVIALYPNNADLYSDRASLYSEIKKFDNSLKDLNMAITIDPDNSSYLDKRANNFKELKQFEKAVKDYSRVILLITANSSTRQVAYSHIERGEVYQLMNQKGKARADFQAACNLSEDLCTSLFFFEKEEAALKKVEQRGKKWVSFSASDNNSFFYDKTRIKQMANKHVRIWIRYEVDDVNVYIEQLKKRDIPTKGYETYSHTLQLWEFDCVNAEVVTISRVEYNDQGNVLSSYDRNKTPAMKSIVPDSIADTLYQISCKERKQKGL